MSKDQKLLIVDDTPANLKVLNDVLKEPEFTTFFASSGKGALAIAKDVEPDLILLDILMPEMDGYAVCKELKSDKETSDIPVIFMTALDQLSNKLEGFKLGAVDYITKPFEIEEVIMRVRNHVQLQKMKKKLESDLALKSRALSMASHEIRRPLTLITMAAQFLKLRPNTEKEVLLKYLNDINQSAQRVTSMLDELLMMIKSEDKTMMFKPAAMNLRELIDSITDEYGIALKDHNFTVGCSEDQMIFADKKLLYMILSNLISNAIKYTGTDGKITLTVDDSSPESISIIIKDCGIGIPAKDIPGMFTQFHRASNVNKVQGTGLGLSIVKQMVEIHSGKIDLESEENVGSTFTVKLPKEKEE